jgi:hypothetical protein
VRKWDVAASDWSTSCIFQSLVRTGLSWPKVKQKNSGDAAGKVVGQALLYYAAALSFGVDGLELLRRYARKNARTPKRAVPKSLQMLSGGLHPPDDWLAIQTGRKLKPSEVALIVGLSEAPPESLKPMLSAFRRHHRIDITVVVAHGRRDLIVWRAI